nr:uncharacterized protein LOC124808183 [Hydra vulgaris]
MNNKSQGVLAELSFRFDSLFNNEFFNCYESTTLNFSEIQLKSHVIVDRKISISVFNNLAFIANLRDCLLFDFYPNLTLVASKRKDRAGNMRGLKGSSFFELIVEVVTSSYERISRREIVNFIQQRQETKLAQETEKKVKDKKKIC